jgi:hypothetical protein
VESYEWRGRRSGVENARGAALAAREGEMSCGSTVLLSLVILYEAENRQVGVSVKKLTSWNQWYQHWPVAMNGGLAKRWLDL